MTRFLIVDDDEMSLRMLQVLLENFGYQVTTAQNGVQALHAARHNPPDIIVTDILMPEMDGFTLCREWKQDKALKDIPLVFYTATFTDEANEEFALSLGAERFIIKTIEPVELIEILRGVIQGQEEGEGETSESVSLAEEYLKAYSATLIRKLESQVEELEEANQQLEKESAERKQAVAALRHEQALTRSLLQNSLDGIFAFDLDSRYTLWNPEMERITGVVKEKVVGRHAFDVFPFLKEMGEDRYFADALAGKMVTATKRTYTVAVTGEQRIVDSFYSPLPDASGKIIGGLVFVRDVTPH